MHVPIVAVGEKISYPEGSEFARGNLAQNLRLPSVNVRYFTDMVLSFKNIYINISDLERERLD